MILRFVAQPFDAAGQMGGLLRAALKLPETSRFWGVTAWAKRSGLARIANALREFRERGGVAEIVLGLDEGGATWEGLRLAIRLFDRAYAYFDPGRRTFHPKFYVAEADETARVFIGSSNLTMGGLFTNYEASVVIELERRLADDRRVLDELDGFYRQLLDVGSACQRLTDASLERLRADPRLNIETEGARLERRAQGRRDPRLSVFGRPVAGLAQAPDPDIPIEDGDDSDRDGDDDTEAQGPQAETPDARAEARRPPLAGLVLVAEIPRAGGRWKQANLDLENYQVFFGLGEGRRIQLRHVRPDGTLDPVENRQGVEVRSRNYRIELEAAIGDYPRRGRPIGLFVRLRPDCFVYRLSIPGDVDYDELSTFLDQNWHGRRDRMRRVRTTVAVATPALGASPVWSAAAQAFPMAPGDR